MRLKGSADATSCRLIRPIFFCMGPFGARGKRSRRLWRMKSYACTTQRSQEGDDCCLDSIRNSIGFSLGFHNPMSGKPHRVDIIPIQKGSDHGIAVSFQMSSHLLVIVCMIIVRPKVVHITEIDVSIASRDFERDWNYRLLKRSMFIVFQACFHVCNTVKVGILERVDDCRVS